MSQQALIHPTAVIDRDAALDSSVRVGAQAYIGPGVEIGAGTTVGPLAVIQGPTRIGRDNRIHAHACLGDAPQDHGYQGEATRLEIGDGNTLREFVTMHRASTKEDGVTRVGNGGMFMAYSHVAHDGQIGDHVTFANGVSLAGHVHVGDHANIGGSTAAHQFVHIGAYAMVGGGSILLKDVPPFVMASGNRARLYGLNRRGLKRAGFDADTLRELDRAYRLLFRSGLPRAEAMAQVQAMSPGTQVQSLITFMEHSTRGVTR